ncbi:Tolloid-like protein 2 [Holothuria leucospilota]|uniref:Tolloid-like protein 2 n=1 Tax=Holothuria leucospilota TaxID=206669 RepID=A0A9Q1BC00_HOLLE|nr:Tolloid-like protein 2 [Holothuria leucospilota]
MEFESPAFRLLHQYNNVLNGFAAEMSMEALEKFRQNKVVEYIEEDTRFSASQTEIPWGLDRIDQISLPLDGLYSPIDGTGSGVNVYIMDSGIYPEHNDFEGRAEIAFDALGGDGRDCYGHGSFCAGVVGGANYGVAKGASMKGVRVLDCNGDGYTSEIIAGCEWLVTFAQQPAVVSASFSGSKSETLDQAISDLVATGIVVVGSAGNNADDGCSYSPSGSAECITVSAMDDKDTRANFANYGSCVDLFAPGIDITSVWIGNADATYTLSGSSVAAPHAAVIVTNFRQMEHHTKYVIAGAAAILLSQDNTLTPAEVKLSLESRAVMGTVQQAGVGSPDRILYIGEGDGPNTPSPALACSDTITEDGSIITSPNYPNNYGNNEDCEYLITAGQGYVISLTFDTFDIEDGSTCQYDALEIYDSSSALASRKIGSYCGSINPGSVVSTDNAMYMEFTTDEVITGQGFRATVSFIQLAAECSCPGTCDNNQQFNSPNYPNNYNDNDLCEYKFSVPPGNGVLITWLDFNVEQAFLGGCFDSVTIYDGEDDSYPSIGEFCGTSLPDPITSSSNNIFLVFDSDSSVTRSGFQGKFSPASLNPPPSTSPPPTTSTTVTPPETTIYFPPEGNCTCMGTCDIESRLFNSPNYPDNYDDNSNCVYRFSVSPGRSVIINWIDFDVEQGPLGECYDSLSVYDGTDNTAPLIGLYCGATPPGDITASSNNVFITFESDGLGTRSGFQATFDETIVPTPTPECDGTYTDEEIVVTSPRFPANYPRNAHCENSIIAPSGQRIEFTFLTMDIEFQDSCNFDSVQLFDGLEVNEAFNISVPLCGTIVPPNPFYSTDNTMHVFFQSDATIQGAGFNATFRFV